MNWNAALVIAGKACALILTSNLIAFHLGKLLPDASPCFETRHLKAERAQGEQERAGRLLAAPREELIITPASEFIFLLMSDLVSFALFTYTVEWSSVLVPSVVLLD